MITICAPHDLFYRLSLSEVIPLVKAGYKKKMQVTIGITADFDIIGLAIRLRPWRRFSAHRPLFAFNCRLFFTKQK